MKIFISYACVDQPLCQNIANYLGRVHEIWYDKRLSAGQQWWKDICERLIWSEAFVYLLSPESLRSDYCRREYTIARDTGKMMFPALIQACDVPPGVARWQYVDLSASLDNIHHLSEDILMANQGRIQRKISQTPVTQVDFSPPIAPPAPLTAANESAEAGNYDRAVFIMKQALANLQEGTRAHRVYFATLEEMEVELTRAMRRREAEYKYTQIALAVRSPLSRQLGCLNLYDFMPEYPDYGDPNNLAPMCVDVISRLAPKRSRLYDILCAPFDLITIPAGNVTLVETGGFESYLGVQGEKTVFDVPSTG